MSSGYEEIVGLIGSRYGRSASVGLGRRMSPA